MSGRGVGSVRGPVGWAYASRAVRAFPGVAAVVSLGWLGAGEDAHAACLPASIFGGETVTCDTSDPNPDPFGVGPASSGDPPPDNITLNILTDAIVGAGDPVVILGVNAVITNDGTINGDTTTGANARMTNNGTTVGSVTLGNGSDLTNTGTMNFVVSVGDGSTIDNSGQILDDVITGTTSTVRDPVPSGDGPTVIETIRPAVFSNRL